MQIVPSTVDATIIPSVKLAWDDVTSVRIGPRVSFASLVSPAVTATLRPVRAAGAATATTTETSRAEFAM